MLLDGDHRRAAESAQRLTCRVAVVIVAFGAEPWLGNAERSSRPSWSSVKSRRRQRTWCSLSSTNRCTDSVTSRAQLAMPTASPVVGTLSHGVGFFAEKTLPAAYVVNIPGGRLDGRRGAR